MTDVLGQAQTNSPLYVADLAAEIQPDLEAFLAFARRSAAAGGRTTMLPPVRISVDALHQLAAVLNGAERAASPPGM